MGVDEPGDDRRAPQRHDPRAAITPAPDLRATAGRHHASGRHGERLHDRASWIEGEDTAALEHEVGGYRIQPFSRYAFSAPGCSGMPTLSGCQAVFGSNSASPA